MVRVTIYEVQDHHISNKQVREELEDYYTFHQSLELQRRQWLEKLALWSCKRGPQNASLSWIYNEPRKQGGQQQHITTSLSNTLIETA